jgi:hypothetical protein
MTPVEVAARRRCPKCGDFELMVLHVANGRATYACARCDHRFAEPIPAVAKPGGVLEDREPATGGKR